MADQSTVTQATITKRADTRAEVIAILEANADAIRGFGATALYLFGSAARDEMGPDSDVDMFVEYQSGGRFSYFDLFELESHVARLLGRDVDMLTRPGLHPYLKDRIERSAVRIF